MIKSRRMGLSVHVAKMGEKRNACRLLVEKPPGRSRHRWVYTIRMEFRDTGWVVWTGLI
jgi:hypothetical protein